MIELAVVRNYIALVKRDHSVQWFDDAIKVFENYAYSDHLQVYDEAINSFPHSTDESRAGYILDQTKEMLIGILQQQGITVKHDIYLTDVTELAAGVRALQDYQPEEDFIQILCIDQSAKESLMACLCHTTKYHVFKLQELIDTVDTSTIDALKAILREKQVVNLHMFTPEHAAVWRRWREFSQLSEEDWISQFCQFSEVMGLPFQSYLTLYKAQCSDRLQLESQEQVDLVAKDMLSMAYLSGDSYTTPLVPLKATVQKLHLDMKQQLALDMRITNLSVEFNQK